ncbi:MAG: endonuclease III domain-containing protein [Acidobacteriia bacterium]|nr:endonuclease III domain-containing protein [Terriglobia bacterium]
MSHSVSLPDFDTRLTKIVHTPARPSLFHHPLLSYYDALFAALGPQHWWPGRTPFEVIVGAILTQNTSWTNVERAIVNLRREKLLHPAALQRVSTAKLARCIRPSGYFRQKALKLKAFVRFLRKEYGGSLARMFRTPTAELRELLLGVHGIGPETADSILLYAGAHPVFVVDAYTRRILERHGQALPRDPYEQIRAHFERHLPRRVPLYNEYHALLVRTAKDWCRKTNPRCAACPLRSFLPQPRAARVLPPAGARKTAVPAP